MTDWLPPQADNAPAPTLPPTNPAGPISAPAASQIQLLHQQRNRRLLIAGCGFLAIVVVFLLLIIAGGAAQPSTVQAGPLQVNVADTPTPVTGAVAPVNRTAEKVYATASPSVVTVRVISKEGTSLGSGFVVAKGGYIITNAHVVDPRVESKAVDLQTLKGLPKINQLYIDYSNGNHDSAKLVGEDPNSDLALIHVDNPAATPPPLVLAKPGSARSGDTVFALGSPFGNSDSLTQGIVSANGRTIGGLVNKYNISGVIQTDAAINKGNSGGPLLNVDGQVLGVNAQLLSDSGGNEGIGYAIPSGTIIQSLAKLQKGGIAAYPLLGISTQTVDTYLAAKAKLPVQRGALIVGIDSNSPAASVGLRSSTTPFTYYGQRLRIGGDIVIAINGKPIKNSTEMVDAVVAQRPGDTVTLTVVSPTGQRRNVDVVLSQR